MIVCNTLYVNNIADLTESIINLRHPYGCRRRRRSGGSPDSEDGVALCRPTATTSGVPGSCMEPQGQT